MLDLECTSITLLRNVAATAAQRFAGLAQRTRRQAEAVTMLSRLRRIIRQRFMVELVGYCAAALTTVAFVPQVIKTWRSKSAGDLSLPMLAAFTSGIVLWLIYGIALGSMPVIAANATTLVLNLVLVGLKLRHGQNRP